MKRFFDEISITENQMAILSASQKKRLWWDITKSSILILIAITVCVIPLIAVRINLSILPALLLIIVVCGFFSYLQAYDIVMKIKDINSSSVYTITGKIKKFMTLKGVYIVQVPNHLELMTTDAVYKELLNKSEYKLFVTENSYKIVNFESLKHGIEALQPPIDKYYIFSRIILYICLAITLGGVSFFCYQLMYNAR